MSSTRGFIRDVDRYRQAKLLDNSSWTFPRGVIPSDVDMIVDNYRIQVLWEFKFAKTAPKFLELEKGQQMLVANTLRNAPTRLTYILAAHQCTDGEFIDSRNDVIQFRVVLVRRGWIAESNSIKGTRHGLFVELVAWHGPQFVIEEFGDLGIPLFDIQRM